jgi:UPF0716 protein FxsA
MALLLMLLFLVVPVAELAVIITVGQSLGVLPTIFLLIAISVAGAWLVKFQGFSILRRIQGQLHSGKLPTKELVDGGLVMFAGALMLTPGFLTDLLALVLLIPPTRAPIRALLMRRFAKRIDTGANQWVGRRSRSRVVVDVVDLTRVDESPTAPPPAVGPSSKEVSPS